MCVCACACLSMAGMMEFADFSVTRYLVCLSGAQNIPCAHSYQGGQGVRDLSGRAGCEGPIREGRV